MSHKGRIFPYLFPRDLYDRGFNHWGFAKRYKIQCSGTWIGSKVQGWVGNTIISDEGVWDYTTGDIVWVFPTPATGDPLTKYQFKFKLRHAEGFGDIFGEWFWDGTLLHRQQAPVNFWNAQDTFLRGFIIGSIDPPKLTQVLTFLGTAVPWAEMPP